MEEEEREREREKKGRESGPSHRKSSELRSHSFAFVLAANCSRTLVTVAYILLDTKVCLLDTAKKSTRA